jgi:DNA-binding beta-propeller fold protein YncE
VKLFAAVLFIWIAQIRQPAADNRWPATKAEINDPTAIAVNGSTLYFAEERAFRRVDLKSGSITAVHTKTPLEAISCLAVDSSGKLIATEFIVDRVRRIDPTDGSVTTIAGGKRLAFSGDGGPAISAGLSRPEFVTTDATNNIYIADMGNSRIRRVDAKTGIITTVAGSGKRDSSGDGGPALDAGLDFPNSVAVDRDGNLFIAQYGYGQDSHRIRRVDAKTGIITTVAGVAKAGLIGDGLPARSVNLQFPSSLLFDPMGNLYVVDPVNDRVRFIDSNTQIIKTIAGSSKGFAGDGGPAIRARLDNPSAIALDSEGNLYIAEFVNHRIRRVDARTGVIQTVAGNGLPKHPHIMM